MNVVDLNRKLQGMHPFWLTPFFELDLPRAYSVLDSCTILSKHQMCTVREVDFQALTKYDTSVFGYPRQTFLHQWLHTPGSHARVAVSHEGNISGYAASRVTFNRQGYRLGPLYANSMEIAEGLMKAIFQEMLDEGWSSSSSVYIVCPIGINHDAKILMERLKAKVCFDSVHQSRKIPNGRFSNWFAIASASIG
ncbi:uncharacterized protein LOC110244309 [Exaiptasia diaphana]|uniref:YitH/HolE acetyltransferase (GNAT) domain-containing protein n=1 Tax=Exaiptasia diaphana TaxID=2652724 RepID=A0A913XL86_EXADI|nr:uncharacterized protein LOC110244309 [Exaiptasia diaphana]